jgi:hypothetical protein
VLALSDADESEVPVAPVGDVEAVGTTIVLKTANSIKGAIDM